MLFDVIGENFKFLWTLFYKNKKNVKNVKKPGKN